MTNREQYERMEIIKDIADKPLTVFQCPYYEECFSHCGKELYWYDNKPVEVSIKPNCKAPLLYNRKTGQTICRLLLERDSLKNWEKIINEIGRRRG